MRGGGHRGDAGCMTTVIEVRGLHKEYGDTVAVDDVSFTVSEGEIFGILGPNGAGKTTTVECVEGLRRPDRGELRVLGLDPLRDRAELTQLLGAVPQLQESQLPAKLRVAEALDLYSSFYRAPAGAEAVRLAQALRPDVVLMDLRMLVMDGVTAIEELAKRGVAARVLVLTTYDTDSYVLPAVEAAPPATCSRTRRAVSCSGRCGQQRTASRCSRPRSRRGC
jgi:ABC-type uncharacterized transport system ATPase subunit